MKSIRCNAAFTLVELSIVLVILGLLVGGVLSGQSLIKSAERRSIITDQDKIKTAWNAFQDKYFAIPGDMNNATSYWGALNPTPATCITLASTDTKTCNGDGNGQISYLNSVPNTYESFGTWKHLANAGLIEGNYDNLPRSLILPGTSAPKARTGDAYWMIWYLIGRTTWTWAPADPGTYLTLASNTGTSTGAWHNPVLKPEDAYNIDIKLDDGNPYRGRIQDMNGSYTPDCTDTNADTAVYNLSYQSLGCLLFIRMD